MFDVLFVYGTLKTDESRGGLWEEWLDKDDYKVKKAFIKGNLHDLGSYPAVVAGEGVVHGQAIFLRKNLLEKLLPMLDSIEGFIKKGHPNNLYNRVKVDAVVDGKSFKVITYFFNGTNHLQNFAKPIKSGVWSGSLYV